MKRLAQKATQHPFQMADRRIMLYAYKQAAKASNNATRPLTRVLWGICPKVTGQMEQLRIARFLDTLVAR